MAYNEKLISEFKQLGNLSDKEANIALQVYLELSEIRRYWNVQFHYNNELACLYFTAAKSKNADSQIYLPRSSTDELSFNKMQKYFALCNVALEKKLFLAFVSEDSTCVFYEILDGLHQPNEIISKHSAINKQEKIDAGIKKHKNIIKEAALCGTSITIREREK